jgi:hypothetical protein
MTDDARASWEERIGRRGIPGQDGLSFMPRDLAGDPGKTVFS